MNTNKKLYKMKSTLHLYNNGHTYESTFGRGGLGYHPMRMRGDGLVGTDDITGGYYYEAPELGIQRTLLEDMDLDEVERILELDKFDVDNYNSMGPVDINKMARRWTYLKYHYDPSMDWGNDDEEEGDNDDDLFLDEPIVAPYVPMPKSKKLSDKQLIENAQYEMGTRRYIENIKNKKPFGHRDNIPEEGKYIELSPVIHNILQSFNKLSLLEQVRQTKPWRLGRYGKHSNHWN